MLMRICQRCGRQVRQGESCPCYVREDREQQAFYSSSLWKRIATAARQRAQYLDEYALKYLGRMQEGGTVHHIYTVRERPDLSLSLDNLVVVSNRTHEKIHQAYNRGGDALAAMRQKLLEIRGGPSL